MNLSPAIVARYNEGPIVAEWDTVKDQMTAKQCAEVLNQHYPGHAWAVHVSSGQGLIKIMDFNLSGQHGYVLHLRGLFSWDDLRDRVMRAGGEMLERAKLPRRAYDDDRVRDLPMSFRGLPVIDTSR